MRTATNVGRRAVRRITDQWGIVRVQKGKGAEKGCDARVWNTGAAGEPKSMEPDCMRTARVAPLEKAN